MYKLLGIKGYLYYPSILQFSRLGSCSFSYFFYFESTKQYVKPQTVEDHILGFLLFLLIFILFFDPIFPKYSPITRWNIAKRYQNNFVKQEDKMLLIDETGIKIISANYREIRQWQSYNDFAENKKIFLLFRNRQSNIIPKRIFETEEQLDSFRTMLANKIKPEKSKK